MNNNFTTEMIEQARAAKSAEELRAIAAGSGMEMTAEQAGAFFNQLHATGELSDEELDNVAGGGCGGTGGSAAPRSVTVSGIELDNRCPVCGYNCWEFYNNRTPSFGNTIELYKCAVCAEKAKAATTGTANVPTCEAIPGLTKNAKSSYVTITL